jgi:hypothetical protein
MKVYIVSYELRKKKNYTGLYEQLKASEGWWHYLDSTWLIATRENAKQLYKRLKPHLDEVEDSILVIEAGADLYGWLPEDAWKWIHRNVQGLTV